MDELSGDLHVFGPYWSLIDESLSNAGEPIHSRPMLAAMTFVKYFVLSVGEEIVDSSFLNKSWFGHFVALSTRWYEERYGSPILAQPDQRVEGVVLIAGVPMPLFIPRVPSWPSSHPAMLNISFTSQIMDHENPCDWVTPVVDFSGIQEVDRQRTISGTCTTARLLRKICHGLMLSDLTSEQLRTQAETIESHLENGARFIRNRQFGVAIWEVHLAIEKSLKVFLIQAASATIPKTHNIRELFQMAHSNGLPIASNVDICALPTAAEAIGYRYSEIPEPNVKDVMSIYAAALRLIAHVASNLTRNAHCNQITEKQLFIQALSWHPKWKQPA